MEEEISHHTDSPDESNEEIKMMLEKYHNLLINREKEFADAMRIITSEGNFHVEDPIPFLKKNFYNFQISLWFETCVRLMIVLVLWYLVLIQAGSTWLTVLSSILTIVIYIGLEILAVHSNLRKANDAIYH